VPKARQTQKQQVATQGQGWRLPLPSWEELDQGNDLEAVLIDAGDHERVEVRIYGVLRSACSVGKEQGYAAWVDRQ